MPIITIPTRWLAALNSAVLAVGRQVAIVLMGLMVLVILLQVVFRYVLNDALPWSEEAARFMMLWMAGLAAPSAYRWGGFVAIDMVPELLPKKVGAILTFCLLLVAMLVLITAVQLGWKHVNSGWLFNSSSLKIPREIWGGEGIQRIKLAWMYLSMFVGVCLLVSVNIELTLRAFLTLFDREGDVPPVKPMFAVEAD